MPTGIFIRTEKYRSNMSMAMKGNKNCLGSKKSEKWKDQARLRMLKDNPNNKKGVIEKIRESKLGDKNYNWKGDKVGYMGLHNWIRRKLGTPTKCEHCGKDGLTGKRIHWANKSHEYKRDLSDWMRLCAECHWIYDWAEKLPTAKSHCKKGHELTKENAIIKKSLKYGKYRGCRICKNEKARIKYKETN